MAARERYGTIEASDSAKCILPLPRKPSIPVVEADILIEIRFFSDTSAFKTLNLSSFNLCRL